MISMDQEMGMIRRWGNLQIHAGANGSATDGDRVRGCGPGCVAACWSVRSAGRRLRLVPSSHLWIKHDGGIDL